MSTPRKTKRPALGSKDLFSELRAVITDQINRYVAMRQIHRDWLSDDISNRVCDLVSDAITQYIDFIPKPVTRGKKKARAK